MHYVIVHFCFPSQTLSIEAAIKLCFTFCVIVSLKSKFTICQSPAERFTAAFHSPMPQLNADAAIIAKGLAVLLQIGPFAVLKV